MTTYKVGYLVGSLSKASIGLIERVYTVLPSTT